MMMPPIALIDPTHLRIPVSTSISMLNNISKIFANELFRPIIQPVSVATSSCFTLVIASH